MTYFTSRQSLFRQYQTAYIAERGKQITGSVVELGGQSFQGHQALFPKASRFTCTNIDGGAEEYRDLTDMREIADESQDAYLCASVLEHIAEMTRGLDEIDRTLKIGGHLILVVPFAVAKHGDVDYWRLGQDAYPAMLPNFEILDIAQFGGIFSSCVDAFQRPRGKVNKRTIIYKTIGLSIGLAGRFLETADGFPLGYGVHAVKRSRAMVRLRPGAGEGAAVTSSSPPASSA